LALETRSVDVFMATVATAADDGVDLVIGDALVKGGKLSPTDSGTTPGRLRNEQNREILSEA
jgi:hypothetical protein